MMRAAWLVAAKDLRLFFRDRVALLVTFALPMVLATVFGAAIGGLATATMTMERVRLLVVDEDQSELSTRIVAELERGSAIGVEVRLDGRARVEQGRAPAAMTIPKGYQESLTRGRPLPLLIHRDPGKIVEQQVLAGNLTPALLRAAGPEVARALAVKAAASKGVPPALVERVMGAAGVGLDLGEAATDALGLAFEDVAGPSERSSVHAARSQAIAGIAVMMLLFGLTACGGTLLDEQASGTLLRLRLAPIHGGSILLGKALFTMVVGLLQILVLFVFGAVVFELPVARAPLSLAVISVVTALSAASMGVLLAVLLRTRKQLEGVSTLLILVMSALGGSWFPLAIVPDWFRALGHLTLNAWAMDAYQAVLWYGRGLGDVWRELGVLLALAALMSALAWRAFERRFTRME
jgi:ABC-2 type transport system permease protein